MIMSHLGEWTASLLTLTLLEIILGVDNLVFISVLCDGLPEEQRQKAWRLGLSAAWITRLILLFCAVWLAQLSKPLLTVFDFSISIRDLFLFSGGMFLVAKATQEIHNELESSRHAKKDGKYHSFYKVIAQIAVLDIIFSLDSVITAIGLTNQFWIMAIAITIAIIVMLFLCAPINRLIGQHPTIRMLAFSFLILIGTMLIADGLHFHIPRGYIYFAVAFSIMVESLNLAQAVKRQQR